MSARGFESHKKIILFRNVIETLCDVFYLKEKSNRNINSNFIKLLCLLYHNNIFYQSEINFFYGMTIFLIIERCRNSVKLENLFKI